MHIVLVLYLGDSAMDTVSIHFTAEIVKKKCMDINLSEAPGTERNWARVLHDLSNVLAEPLALVYIKKVWCLLIGYEEISSPDPKS